MGGGLLIQKLEFSMTAHLTQITPYLYKQAFITYSLWFRSLDKLLVLSMGQQVVSVWKDHLELCAMTRSLFSVQHVSMEPQAAGM